MNDILEIKITKDIEPFESWPDICKNPNIFFAEIAKRLYINVDIKQLSQNIIISPSIPTAENRGKLWIKTSWPYGIGIVANGEYVMDYGMSGFPVNIPFLHKQMNVKPEYVSVIGSIDLESYGMKDIDTKDSSKRFLWHIFSPPRIIL
jgi:hypothetical protein